MLNHSMLHCRELAARYSRGSRDSRRSSRASNASEISSASLDLGVVVERAAAAASRGIEGALSPKNLGPFERVDQLRGRLGWSRRRCVLVLLCVAYLLCVVVSLPLVVQPQQGRLMSSQDLRAKGSGARGKGNATQAVGRKQGAPNVAVWDRPTRAAEEEAKRIAMEEAPKRAELEAKVRARELASRRRHMDVLRVYCTQRPRPLQASKAVLHTCSFDAALAVLLLPLWLLPLLLLPEAT